MAKILKKLDPKLCRVCGCEHEGFPWGEDGQTPSYEFCDCCGIEFGYQDASLAGVRKAREQWMLKTYAWDRPERCPPGWAPEAQLSRLKDTEWDPWG